VKARTARRQKPSIVPAGPIPGTLTPAAMEDLFYLDPPKARERLISILNEFGQRIATLEAMHREHNDG
jgi:hypothetical protein